LKAIFTERGLQEMQKELETRRAFEESGDSFQRMDKPRSPMS